MQRRLSVVWLAVVCGVALGGTAPRVRRWVERHREWVAAPGQSPMQLHDVLATNTNLKYSDHVQRLTVIKDVSSDIRACFITDLDPEWSLSYADKMQLMDSLERQDIRSRNDLFHLQQRAGPDIANMCMKMHIYWLNNPPMPVPKHPSGAKGLQAPPSLSKTPPPLMKTPPELTRTSPPVYKVPIDQGVVGHGVKAPEFHAPSAPMRTPPPLFKTPPPLHAAKVVHSDVVAAPDDKIHGHEMRTPPPLFKTPPPLHAAKIVHNDNVPVPERMSAPGMRMPPLLFKTPPPLHAAKVAHADVIAAPDRQPVHQMKTPPPLGVYRAKGAPPTLAKSPPFMMRVPPPPQQYRRMKNQESMRVPPPM